MKNVHFVGYRILASLLAVGITAPRTFAQEAAPAAIHLEAEDAALQGPSVMTDRAGFMGRGYVSDFSRDTDKITWTFAARSAGLYEVRIRYCSPYDEKGYDLSVNGAKISPMFAHTGEAFALATAGKVELRAGQNTIVLEKGWGYYDIDALDLVPVVTSAALKPVPATLADPAATAGAKALFNALLSTYGKKTLSGQYDTPDNNYIRTATGKMPAIKGGDLLEYSPSRIANGADPKNTSEDLIQDARNGQIVTLSWHWNAPSGLYNRTYTDAKGKKVDAPWWRGFDTDASTFDLQKALANPNSQDYKLLLRDIDAIAVQLKKFSDAGVPVLWRPLHEAEGGWFWWGAKGPDAFKKLWQLTFTRLTQVYKLHNLIWVYTAGTKIEWYPGDKYVDIVGVDAYPTDPADPLSQTWDDLKKQFDGRKMMAISEFGKVPDIAKMHRLGERWAYFVSWSGDLGAQGMPKAALPGLYTNPLVVNRSDLKITTLASGLIVPPTTIAPTPTPAQPTATEALSPSLGNYRLINTQVTASLHRDVLQNWFPRASTETTNYNDGFHQNFAADWTTLPGEERSIVYQSRLTWLAAEAAIRLPDESNFYARYSKQGLDLLLKTMWDQEQGGFFWEVGADGKPARDGEKHAYGIAFAIYAASANYEATHDPRALDLAQRAFRWLDAHAHDAQNKGYFEALRRDGTPILQVPDGADVAGSGISSTDCIGTRYGFKTMNTHIHLLEAFANLYHIWPDPLLHERLQEVFGLVRDTIVVPEVGAMNLFFTPTWRAVPDHDSFGHDVETAYLLVEAAQTLGMPDDSTTWNVARRLVDHALAFGWDEKSGGFYDTGGTFTSPVATDKVWWVQAEGLNALLLMHERYGRETPRYWNAFLHQWGFISNHQIDAVNTGWLQSVSATGVPVAGQVKSDRWTECYHQGRALLNVSATLMYLSNSGFIVTEIE